LFGLAEFTAQARILARCGDADVALGIDKDLPPVVKFGFTVEGAPRGYPRPMTRETVHAAGAPPAIGPYSHAVRAEGKFLFCSGQIPLTPEGDLVTGDVRVQTEQVLQNIRAVLAASGLNPDHIVKTTIFLSSMDHFAAVNEVYATLFTQSPPARSTVAVAGLPKGADVEIEVIAVF
jgi:2-iminobutanoate/2-iminopropanoate deaminase